MFESIYGSIPDRISSFDKREFETVLTPKSWVFDDVISAFLMLLNRDTVLALDTVFVTMLRQAIRNKYIATHAEFLEFFFGQNLHNTMNQLKISQSVLIPVFNSKMMRTKNGRKKYFRDHRGLAVLDKHSASLRLYDSSHTSRGFDHILPHLLQLANSICSKYELTEAEWPMQWTY